MKRAFLALAVVATMSGARVRAAHALDYVHFAGGPMKNLTVDLIFWGSNFTNAERATVMQTVVDIGNWLNGTGGNRPPPGMEPALHYYGPSAIYPGLWINDPSYIGPPFLPGGCCGLDDSNFQSTVTRAELPQRGDSAAFNFFDFSGNAASPTLPAASNRLALVITKGTNDYCISAHRAFGCVDDWGYHDVMSGHPYGAVMFDNLSPTLSHEIFEAMSDPYVFNGWVADNGIFSQNEMADECQNQSGGSEFAWLTVDAPFTMSGVNTQYASCMQTIPEQHAPLAATFGYGGMGTVPLYLFFGDQNGHLQYEYWGDAGQVPSGPYDLGQPAPGVTVAGKPSVVFQNYNTYIFVRGSDNALWMFAGNTWTYLGGYIFGDPSAVSWVYSGAQWIHVAVLGTDSYVWLYSLRLGVPQGWGQVYTGGTLMVGPPNLLSQGADSLDVFATGEDGQIKWVQYRSAWLNPVTVSHDYAIPITSKPAITRINGNGGIELIATSGISANSTSMWQTSYNGSSWSSFVPGAFNITPDAYNYGFEGTPALVSNAANRVDVFSVARSGKLWWFWNANQPGNSQWHTMNTLGAFVPPALVNSGATGDPIAVSRGAGKMEVFYRTNDGRLAHMTTTNSGSSWTTETVLPVNSIQ